MANLIDIPSKFEVDVQIDDGDIYRLAVAAYLGIAFWYLLKKGKK